MKKDLKNNATAAVGMFMDIPTEQPTNSTESAGVAAETAEQPAGFAIKKDATETKSRRLQLMIRPSVYEAVAKAAKASGTTVNDFINQALEYVTKGN